MIRVSLLVSGAVLRRGLEEVLGDFPSVEVTGSAGWPGDEAVVRDADAREPDVVIVSDPEIDARMFIEGLPDPERPPAVLLLSDDPGAAGKWLGLSLRALGVLPASAEEDELEAALLALARGLSVWRADQPAGFQILSGGTSDDPPARLAEEIELLTDRELEVLQLLALGLANKKIALDLSISEHTVKFHISSIYGKLGAGNRTEAVRIGLQTGLISI